tara:strand:- start:108 stop:644 length:537 start_codon:yes stop_codon:yes gene_type:complete
MKNFRTFLREAVPTNSTGDAVQNWPYFLFPKKEDELSQDYQTPDQPGQAKWRFSNVYPIQKLSLQDVDTMVDASDKFVGIQDEGNLNRRLKNFSTFVEETQNCPKGKYYCHKDKKCKPIPRGYYVGARGWLKPDPNDEENKNGTRSSGSTNGHVNTSNGNSNGGNNGGNGGNGNGGGE